MARRMPALLAGIDHHVPACTVNRFCASSLQTIRMAFHAIQALLAQTGVKIDDVDVVEINEAFAAQIVPCKDELRIPDEKLNPFGGAIALGHPFGMTGARIMTTLINGLRARDGTLGIESMCVAGGMGQAMLIERLD
jgi:acetyl-CoA C-acetyltransferase